MSRIDFHSPSGTAEIRGSERAWFGCLTNDVGLAPLRNDLLDLRGTTCRRTSSGRRGWRASRACASVRALFARGLAGVRRRSMCWARIGEEIAKSPPAWAYPLAWRLAVMAHVENENNGPVVLPMKHSYATHQLSMLKHYHAKRLEGAIVDVAMRWCDENMTSWTQRICGAYERGRPGPGGVKVGRPA